MFNRVDADSNGTVTPEELVAYFPDVSSDMAAFLVLAGDIDGDGVLNLKECKKLISEAFLVPED